MSAGIDKCIAARQHMQFAAISLYPDMLISGCVYKYVAAIWPTSTRLPTINRFLALCIYNFTMMCVCVLVVLGVLLLHDIPACQQGHKVVSHHHSIVMHWSLVVLTGVLLLHDISLQDPNYQQSHSIVHMHYSTLMSGLTSIYRRLKSLDALPQEEGKLHWGSLWKFLGQQVLCFS